MAGDSERHFPQGPVVLTDRLLKVVEVHLAAFDRQAVEGPDGVSANHALVDLYTLAGVLTTLFVDCVENRRELTEAQFSRFVQLVEGTADGDIPDGPNGFVNLGFGRTLDMGPEGMNRVYFMTMAHAKLVKIAVVLARSRPDLFSEMAVTISAEAYEGLSSNVRGYFVARPAQERVKRVMGLETAHANLLSLTAA